jgi:hypothetical protein
VELRCGVRCALLSPESLLSKSLVCRQRNFTETYRPAEAGILASAAKHMDPVTDTTVQPRLAHPSIQQ